LRALSGALLLLGLIWTGCNSDQEASYQFTRFAMGTVIDYTIFARDRSTAREFMLQAQNEIERVEHLLWEENPESEIARFNQSNEGIYTTEEVFRFLQRAQEYSRLEMENTFDGAHSAFDMTVKPVLALYDFDAEDAVPPAADQINRKLQYVGMDNIRLSETTAGGEFFVSKQNPQVALAVGGIAKGYAVDKAIDLLKEAGVKNVLINAGGDLYCLGEKAGQTWRVGIQQPKNPQEIREVLNLQDIAVATSGDYQKYFMYEGIRYHHILNPEIGKPARNSRSATVIAPTVEEADVWATVLFIRSAPEGILLLNTLPEISGMVIDSSGNAYYSEGFLQYLE